jgi:TRAP-type C4-dicarboxylate transport system permease small subunit
MNKKKLESWVWLLIYGGMIGFSLGWFLESRSAALGWPLLVLGAASIAGGALLIFLRSRMPP